MKLGDWLFSPLDPEEVQIRLYDGIAQSGSLNPILDRLLPITQVVASVTA